ncbi:MULTISPECIES: hypothetical protein [Oceanospirillaceae]|jgi:xanthosine utilization system XapX-like protein|nr:MULTISPECIES: hypothetical protein [Thalassolituus]|tara:strand:- start:226 stop:360 length:135 start_codon:yes stop_codon:yes gene_type:complete
MITYSLLAGLLLAGCLYACLQRIGRSPVPQEIAIDPAERHQRKH